MELSKHGVIDGSHNTCCRFVLMEKKIWSIFFSCVVTSLCWKKFSNWLGVDLNSHADSLLLCFSELKRSLNLKLHVDFH